MPRESFSDQIFKGVADAIADIREKLVEEPFFGRAVGGERVSVGPLWQETREAEPEKSPEPEREREHRAPDHDMDR